MTESTATPPPDPIDDEALCAAIDRSIAAGRLIIVQPATLAAFAELLDALREGG